MAMIDPKAMSVGAASKLLGQHAAKRMKKSGFHIDEKKFIAKLRKHGVVVNREVMAEMRRFMALWERTAKKRAPVQFGFLRASVWWRIGRSGDRIIGELGSSTGYGKYTEFVDRPSSSRRSIYQAARRKPSGYRGLGTVANPYTWWPAKSGMNTKGHAASTRETMPWARPALVEAFKSSLHKRLQRAFKRAQRRM